jgi:hypothetical protein
MANAIRRKYQRNFCVGLRLEVPNKFLGGVDLAKIYKKSDSILLFDFCRGGKVVSKRVKEFVLAKSEGEGGSVSSFSVMINFKSDLEKVKRIIGIINVLGDGRLFKEKAKTFVDGRSILNSIPELAELKRAFCILFSAIPKSAEYVWYSAPDAKLR